MGRLNGLVGGFVLTTSVMYLTIRQHQEQTKLSSQLLRDSNGILNAILEPPPPPKPRTTYVETRSNILETMKDNWNSEIEGVVRWVQNANPTSIFNSIEDMARSTFSELKQLGGGSVGSGK
ncbi:hypothetical protein TWF569_011456 [Orbilia oligospora]|uniref:MICOS complex subunit MIC12 n=1 Tax=Orbilia oligospora TaxID=2813651 RepID=A0A7C8JH34_ORBOL|nr:hypothetical protein TWF706_010717 [Orbilia oligospora]KAF3091057.1 hypothetical protein TWF102_008937 [Orbilia oligospora]KAF3097870.1 hypothetical protein TWF103_009259 [Orbilia oligospora]KAF3123426.1 hypothetical protein TWF703_000902 [Orbilia oligospora]KAF3131142.1 hypothetical protein TWF569_011456 [Orbilia oligospora]